MRVRCGVCCVLGVGGGGGEAAKPASQAGPRVLSQGVFCACGVLVCVCARACV